jgi:uncharacterized protein YlxW (UPF0749 family)
MADRLPGRSVPVFLVPPIPVGNATCFVTCDDHAAMKTFCLIACFAAFTVCHTRAQAPDTKARDEQLLALVKQVQEQQAQISANQKKIDGKLAELAETIRTARLFSSRTR